MFTVRWPVFARLEAVLFFPVTLSLSSEIEAVRKAVDLTLVPALAPVLHDRIGLPYVVIYWITVGMVAFLPFFVALLVADRLMTVRKGYALLGFLAIAAWAATAMRLSDVTAIRWPFTLLPDSMIGDNDWLTFEQQAAIAAAALAALIHAHVIMVGLRDEGDVAMRLIAAREEARFARSGPEEGRRAQDVYYRQTAQFRGWQPDQRERLGGGPKESSAVKFLSAITWIGVIAGLVFAYLNWNGFLAPRGATPEVQSSPAAGPALASRAPLPPPAINAPGSQPAAVVGAPMPGSPMAGSHAAMAAPLPSVQRPTELSSSVQAAGISIGPNEAVAERGSDGAFAFDAVVNGGHVPMLFDTGASVVALRFEDAVRLGIPVAKLNYSARVKTANGTADVAPVMIDTLTVGNITQRAVQGFVAKQGMLQVNLLGQTFLARLAGYNVDRNMLVLRGR
jgi:clan AA aspartic protease (TIGR02281 family)